MKNIDEVKEELRKLLKENNCAFMTLQNGKYIDVNIYLCQSDSCGTITTKLK